MTKFMIVIMMVFLTSLVRAESIQQAEIEFPKEPIGSVR